jgi:single-strand DNA-binding protein
LGRLGRDPEIRKTSGSGKVVCNFSIATSEKRGDKEETTWHEIVTWEKTAENCAKFLAKGREVFVEGRIQVREYEAKDGTKRKAHEIVADRVTFIGSSAKTAAVAATAEASGEPALDDVPF